MPTTRSQTKQSHIEDFVKDEKPAKALSSKTKSNTSKAKHLSPKSRDEVPKAKDEKTRPADLPQRDQPAKRQKTASKSSTSVKKSMSKQNAALLQGKDKDASTATKSRGDSDDTIMINRAPVLDLWATTVTHFLYPSLPWNTCLSAGSAVSALCAVSKGRSIGVIDPKDEQDRSSKAEDQQADDVEEIEVMGFTLKLKDDLVVVGVEKKPANEGAQKKKFGESHYQQTKKAFEDALHSWGEDKGELNKKAFGFYEKFRPTVAQGQQGWGKKGELSLSTVKEVVQKT